jgi:hypothetical protein
LHEYVLALWGMPLGEMFDLERLSEKCKERKRWTFFFTSSPAHVKGTYSRCPLFLDLFFLVVQKRAGWDVLWDVCVLTRCRGREFAC